MLPLRIQKLSLVERVRWLRYLLPPFIAAGVVFYQLVVARRLSNEFGEFFHYSVEIGFYSLIGPIVSWLTLAWVERSLIEKDRLEKHIEVVNKQLVTLTNASADGIISLDQKGRITSWNEGASRIMGFSWEEMTGKKIATIINLELEDLLSSGSSKQIREYEFAGKHARGRALDLEVSLSCMSGEGQDGLPIALMIVRDISARKEREQGIEEERARISRDLHDGIAQTLFHLAVESDAAQRKAEGRREDSAFDFGEHGRKIRGVIHELRRTIFAMQELGWEAGVFIPALEAFTQRFAEQMDLHIRSRFPADEVVIAERLQPVIFRVIQESLNNVVKHAEAKEVEIELEADRKGGAWTLSISDDGRGFPQNLEEQEGIGISQMRMRILRVGGELTVAEAAKGGAKVLARFPKD